MKLLKKKPKYTQWQYYSYFGSKYAVEQEAKWLRERGYQCRWKWIPKRQKYRFEVRKKL